MTSPRLGGRFGEEQLRRAAFVAPMGRELHRDDTRIVAREGFYQVITPSVTGYLNEVYQSDLRADEADRVIDGIVAEHRARRAPVKWCVGYWSAPSDLRERLVARGFEARPVRAMACTTDLAIATPAFVEVREVREEDVDAYVAFETRAWGIAEEQQVVERRTHRAAITASPRTAHFFWALEHGSPIGSCGVFLRHGFGYLVGGVVVPGARGRGVYRSLVAARLAFLAARGIELAVTHARDATSSPMLEHLGFETVYRYECLYLEAEAEVG